ncbi:hypothetical protein BC828DRAFT_375590 [Blastocladiella britannica]|nr:hypothetical protein BC828DRAFT_375590 [Blastocladiella britannica]
MTEIRSTLRRSQSVPRLQQASKPTQLHKSSLQPRDLPIATRLVDREEEETYKVEKVQVPHTLAPSPHSEHQYRNNLKRSVSSSILRVVHAMSASDLAQMAGNEPPAGGGGTEYTTTPAAPIRAPSLMDRLRDMTGSGRSRSSSSLVEPAAAQSQDSASRLSSSQPSPRASKSRLARAFSVRDRDYKPDNSGADSPTPVAVRPVIVRMGSPTPTIAVTVGESTATPKALVRNASGRSSPAPPVRNIPQQWSVLEPDLVERVTFGQNPLSSSDLLGLLPGPVDTSQLSKSEIKRQETIYELTVTESDYVGSLIVLRRKFLHPIAKNQLLSAQELSSIFSDVEQLIPLNQELLGELEKRRALDRCVVTRVGSIFKKLAPFFKMYNTYCTNIPDAQNAVIALQQSRPAFKEFLIGHPDNAGLDISSLLIKPVQRLCKYPLLLREILKHTPASHADHADLTTALAVIEKTVHRVNEGRRFLEDQRRLLTVLAHLEFDPRPSNNRKHLLNASDLDDPYMESLKWLPENQQRRVLRQDPGYHIHDAESIAGSTAARHLDTVTMNTGIAVDERPRLLVLFSDALVVAKPRGGVGGGGAAALRMLADSTGTSGNSSNGGAGTGVDVISDSDTRDRILLVRAMVPLMAVDLVFPVPGHDRAVIIYYGAREHQSAVLAISLPPGRRDAWVRDFKAAVARCTLGDAPAATETGAAVLGATRTATTAMTQSRSLANLALDGTIAKSSVLGVRMVGAYAPATPTLGAIGVDTMWERHRATAALGLLSVPQANIIVSDAPTPAAPTAVLAVAAPSPTMSKQSSYAMSVEEFSDVAMIKGYIVQMEAGTWHLPSPVISVPMVLPYTPPRATTAPTLPALSPPSSHPSVSVVPVSTRPATPVVPARPIAPVAAATIARDDAVTQIGCSLKRLGSAASAPHLAGLLADETPHAPATGPPRSRPSPNAMRRVRAASSSSPLKNSNPTLVP